MSFPSSSEITNTNSWFASTPTCFAFPIFFALSSKTSIPKIDLNSPPVGIGSCTISDDIVSSWTGVSKLERPVSCCWSIGFANPTFIDSSGFLNSLYSAIVASHPLHRYFPLSAKTKFSATSSFGFSNSIFGLPSNSFSHVLHVYLEINSDSNLPIGAKNRSGPPRFPLLCCSSVTLAITNPPEPLSFFNRSSALMFSYIQYVI